VKTGWLVVERRRRAPDLFLRTWVDGTISTTTPITQDSFTATFPGAYDVSLVDGATFIADAWDSDVTTDDHVMSCQAAPIMAALLRGRDLACNTTGSRLRSESIPNRVVHAAAQRRSTASVRAMPEWMRDWGWKVAGTVVPALLGVMFRSERVHADQCANCQRSTDYRVVGGITRGIAVLLGLAGGALAVFSIVLIFNDAIPVELGIGIIVVGYAIEIFFIKRARALRNALKCIVCGYVQPLTTIEDREEAVQERPKRKTAKRRKR
jgi:hypothetical protein